MEFKLKSGKVVTDEEIRQMAEAIENGELPGAWSGEVVRGRPRLSNEPLVTIPVKFPQSVVDQIDARTNNRSDFIRKAVAAQL